MLSRAERDKIEWGRLVKQENEIKRKLGLHFSEVADFEGDVLEIYQVIIDYMEKVIVDLTNEGKIPDTYLKELRKVK